jgi:hypothetical protein
MVELIIQQTALYAQRENTRQMMEMRYVLIAQQVNTVQLLVLIVTFALIAQLDIIQVMRAARCVLFVEGTMLCPLRARLLAKLLQVNPLVSHL